MEKISYRNLFIENKAYLSVSNNNLTLEGEKGACTIPLEDIGAVLIDNRAVELNSYVLEKMIKNDICLIVTDEKHLPSGIMHPYNCYSRTLKSIRLQINASKPFCKRLWQRIVRQKISNQAACLKLCGADGEERLLASAQRVTSGDTANEESIAAIIYFKALFGSNFNRREDNVINSALNYAYAVIRAVIAKNICIYGMEPSLGIFHHSELNNFNLADDLIEAYRPIADMFVKQNIEYLKRENQLSPSVKHDLFSLLNAETEIEGQRQRLSYSAEITVQSYIKSLNDKEDKLRLPRLIGTEQHVYE